MRTVLYSTLNPVLEEGCCSFIWLLIVRACDEFSNLKRCVPLDLRSTIHLFVIGIPNCGFMSTLKRVLSSVELLIPNPEAIIGTQSKSQIQRHKILLLQIVFSVI